MCDEPELLITRNKYISGEIEGHTHIYRPPTFLYPIQKSTMGTTEYKKQFLKSIEEMVAPYGVTKIHDISSIYTPELYEAACRQYREKSYDDRLLIMTRNDSTKHFFENWTHLNAAENSSKKTNITMCAIYKDEFVICTYATAKIFVPKMVARMKHNVASPNATMQCCICLEDQVLISCNIWKCCHSVCRSCATNMLRTKTNCPLCRANVAKNTESGMELDRV